MRIFRETAGRGIPSPVWERGRGEGGAVPNIARLSSCQHRAQSFTLKRVTLTPGPSPTRERGDPRAFSLFRRAFAARGTKRLIYTATRSGLTFPATANPALPA
ncbi:hypothetical protein mvi_06470 [Methylobacterium indicum]|uniref:Uncharacterized protein n=1 Tax=Methylobacterium indicum TaxID=1775910 RepID=A0A8H9C484_9HYPH|nr:hypothetical protein mvi_06470 [Methylobacterium indicum]